jgi:uncharacterized protein YihD (DUF1040 family)
MKRTRNPDRIPKILTLLGQVWMKEPDMRFFQLLTHLGFLEPQGDGTIEDPFYKEDDEILNAVYNKAKLERRNRKEAKKTGLKNDRPTKKINRKSPWKPRPPK